MYSLIRSLLFHLDAEAAHEWTAGQMMALQEIPIALRMIERFTRPPASAARELFGLRFPSPVGIAAGFDKNAQLIPMLAALGFGFIEVGTVTLVAQAGNPRPRLFRYPTERALINRMGFNNDGVEAVIERLRSTGETLVAPPVFVSVGKNRQIDNYAECYEKAAPYADVVVLNLSSPNTPGLRDFQRPEQMERLLRSISRRGPVLVKIAPDLDDAQLGEICAVCVQLADGMICTNTTVDRLPDMNEVGGLSGAPLMKKSTDILRKVRERAGSAYPLIGVGGIFTAEDVRSKMIAGADLVQVYTSFVYEGPLLPRRLARAL
ncbi:MAG TPA: quinone-dependent dihydroorotate dehydrogenase [Thermoanaerobaculia bacterium]|nr:quinone-dependent dihydroorotate dehydrogenase [Thermoanaerobaculia bacterium]